MTSVSGSATVGIDIGSTAVKAVAADADGRVLARVRVPHRLISTASDRLEHDAEKAWRRGPRQALAEVSTGLDVAGVCVAGMVPSLAAVDRRGRPLTPGLLYGDARGYLEEGVPPTPGSMPDAEGFVRWAHRAHPDAAGYWPAQAVAGYALAQVPAIDSAMSATLGRLLHWGQWSEATLTEFGVRPDQMPTIVPLGGPAGTVTGTGAVLAGGTVDALCDQIVAGADEVGDVLVVCGATLIVWAVIGEWVDAPGLWTIPHTVPDRILIGGPSNAGALFVDWARSLLRGGFRRPPAERSGPDRHPAGELAPRAGDPERIPVWLPYLRGERVPFHDPTLRSGLHGLDITQDATALERAAYEASGFVIRRIVERGGVAARRIVASGGGTRVGPWMQAMADAAGLPVDVVAVPEGAALGAAYLARMAAGLAPTLEGSGAWARVGYRVDPDPAWQAAAARRYQRFVDLGPGA